MAEHNKHDDFVPLKKGEKRWKKANNEKSAEFLELLQIYQNIIASNPDDWKTFFNGQASKPLNWFLKDKNIFIFKLTAKLFNLLWGKGAGIIFIYSPGIQGFRSFSLALF